MSNSMALPLSPKLAANLTQNQADAIHVLNRFAFGPSPDDLLEIQSMGINAYIQAQLSPQNIPDSKILKQALAPLRTARASTVQRLEESLPPRIRLGKKPTASEQKTYLQRKLQFLDEAVTANLMRSAYSDRQLEAVMTQFWFNHFNVFARKGSNHVWVGHYEQNAIRPYALGQFRDLLLATAQHPAMLTYLDNHLNTAPKSPGARGAFKGLNENYARELLELHTLGVNGGYTQADVIAAAKIFTGWGLPRLKQRTVTDNPFYFDRDRHDFSDKKFLDTTIQGSGLAEGEQVLDLLAQHPATAKHLSYKLAQYFVADDPPSKLVTQLSKRYLSTNGNIREVLATLFDSEEFWDQRYRQNKFKTPYEYVVSAIRATGSTEFSAGFAKNAIRGLNMPIYMCLTPDGYANTQATWLNPSAIQRRLSLAVQFANQVSKQTPELNPLQVLNTTGLTKAELMGVDIDKKARNFRLAMILGHPKQMYR